VAPNLQNQVNDNHLINKNRQRHNIKEGISLETKINQHEKDQMLESWHIVCIETKNEVGISFSIELGEN
jgi:hypothetical protein